jgi:hypothetical protein
MQQRQLRLGDILDDYCPRERRVTNHAIVAMIGSDVKQTRCTTCDAEHEYKHARVPRQRRKADTPAALYSQVLANAPKRVAHEPVSPNGSDAPGDASAAQPVETPPAETTADGGAHVPAHVASQEVGDEAAAAPERESIERDREDEASQPEDDARERGPVHRPLIRASLPRPEGQQPPARPIPEFTIRQPGGRPNRFRPRHQRGGQQFHGNRGNGAGAGPRSNVRSSGGRPPQAGRRHGPGRNKRSK